MKTRTTTASLCLLVVLAFGFLCQDIHAGVVQAKQGKPKNSTSSAKEGTTANSKTKHSNKVKTSASTSTTSTTTVKPKQQDSTTVKPLQVDLDGRNAYIDNHFVADQEPILDNTQPLYEILQQQMEKVLSNTGFNGGVYADSPQGKEMPEDNQNAPGKPMFSYNMNQFNDYDEETENENEEDLLDQEEQQQPENCEDTEESLGDNDDNGAQYASPPASPQNNYQQGNAPQNSYNQNKPSGNKPGKNPYDTPTNNQAGYGQSSSNKPSSSQHYHKPAAPQNSYGQSNPPSHAHEKPKPAKPFHSSHKPSKVTANQENKQSHKPTKPPAPSSDGNSNPSSPFSTPTSTTNNNNNSKQSSKRHLTFRTVSSSTQFVSTPLADLMLKFSIGMAKPSKSQTEGNQESQVYDKNDIEMTV